jgi:hypothetical protein
MNACGCKLQCNSRDRKGSCTTQRMATCGFQVCRQRKSNALCIGEVSLSVWQHVPCGLAPASPSAAKIARPRPRCAWAGRRPSLFSTDKGAVCGRLLREIARQSFLVAARDQFGLRTRDVSLGDQMPGKDANAPFEVVTVSGKQLFLEVRQGPSDKILLHRELQPTPVPLDDVFKGGVVLSIDYLAVLEEMEKLSRAGFTEAIKRAGFQGKPNGLNNSGGDPQEVETASYVR